MTNALKVLLQMQSGFLQLESTVETNLVLCCTVYRWHALEFALELMQSR
jgi:hypothetical protein